jgi:hypothetical protein
MRVKTEGLPCAATLTKPKRRRHDAKKIPCLKIDHIQGETKSCATGSGVNPDPLFVLNPLAGSLYDERLYRLVR